MRVSGIAACLCLLPGLGQASCPAADDLFRGVEVTFQDGHVSRFLRDAEGVLTETEIVDDGSSFNYVTDNNVLETAFFELPVEGGDPVGWEEFAYSFDVSGILPLQQWSGQSGYQILLAPDGSEARRTLFGYRTRAARDLTIGTCTFTAIPLETYYQSDDNWFRSVTFEFVTELSIPITVSFADQDGAETWVPADIKLLEPAPAIAFSEKNKRD